MITQMKLSTKILHRFFPKPKLILETLMKENNFLFDLVKLLYWKCHKINFKLGGSCIEPLD